MNAGKIVELWALFEHCKSRLGYMAVEPGLPDKMIAAGFDLLDANADLEAERDEAATRADVADERLDEARTEVEQMEQLISGNARRLGLLARKHTPGETLTAAETGELAALQEAVAQVFLSTGPADLRAMQMETERDKAMAAKAETREQLSNMAMSNAQLLLDNLELKAAKAELVAVLRLTEIAVNVLWSRLGQEQVDSRSYGTPHDTEVFSSACDDLLAVVQDVAAALAKRGGDDATQ